MATSGRARGFPYRSSKVSPCVARAERAASWRSQAHASGLEHAKMVLVEIEVRDNLVPPLARQRREVRRRGRTALGGGHRAPPRTPAVSAIERGTSPRTRASRAPRSFETLGRRCMPPPRVPVSLPSTRPCSWTYASSAPSMPVPRPAVARRRDSASAMTVPAATTAARNRSTSWGRTSTPCRPGSHFRADSFQCHTRTSSRQSPSGPRCGDTTRCRPGPRGSTSAAPTARDGNERRDAGLGHAVPPEHPRRTPQPCCAVATPPDPRLSRVESLRIRTPRYRLPLKGRSSW